MTEGEALGHTAGEPSRENEVAPTCTEQGSYDEVVKCTVCDKELSRETKTVEANGHSWTDINVVKPATCEEEGLVYKECQTCGSREEQKTPALGHKEKTREENWKAATCTEAGSVDVVTYCTECQKVLSTETKTIDALGHDWKQTGEVIKESTCTEHGYGKQVCQRFGCGEVTSGELPLAPHTEGEAVEENRVESTCTVKGHYDSVVYCSECKAELSRETVELELAAHTKAEEVKEFEVEPTCEKPGYYYNVVYCSVCGEEVSRSSRKKAAKLGHKEAAAVEENRVAATCTEDGSYDEVVYCSVCGKELNRTQQTIPAAHTWETVKFVEAPTCTKNGIGYQECSVCGAKNTEGQPDGTVVLPMLGHDLAEAVKENYIAPTCTEDGSYDSVQKCTRCDYSEITQMTADEDDCLKALGHEWSEEYVSEEPTCTATGKGYYICQRCGKTDTEHEIPALGHDWEERVVPDSSTFTSCTEESKYAVANYCKRCDVKDDDSVKEVTVPAKDSHTYNAEDVEFVWNSSDDKSGVAIFTCAVEGCTDIHRIMFAIDTEDENSYVVDKEPTCTEKGEGHYVATVEYEGVTAKADYPTTFEIAAKGHVAAEPVAEVIKKETHEEAGLYQWITYCSVCGEKLEEGEKFAVEPTGHEGAVTTTEVIKAPTCTEEGSYDIVVYCPECDKEISRETMVSEPTGHVWNDPVVENKKPATCTEEGSYETVVYCAACGAEQEGSRESHVIEKIEHTPVTDAAVAATCTKTGLTEGSHCLVCDTVLVEQKVTEKLAHTPVTDGAVAATCTKTGLTEGSHCKVCGEVLKAQKTTEKLAHKAAAPVKELIKEATYTAPGAYNEVVYCADCHAKLSSTEKAIEQLKPQGQKIKVNKETKSKTYKAKSVKKAKKSFRISATAPSGKLTYKKLSGSSRITVGKSGKITVKKGTKKGTYKVRVKIYAPGTAEYKAVNKTITVKVVVK